MDSNRAQIVAAQDELRSELIDALGPELPGISGFGAGLDYKTHRLTLNVRVNNAATARKINTKLPKLIGGLPIRVSRHGTAIFD